MTEQDKLFLLKVKRCFIYNIGYFIVGLILFLASLLRIVVNPEFSWVMIIVLTLAISLILFSGITIIRCISHINVERAFAEEHKT